MKRTLQKILKLSFVLLFSFAFLFLLNACKSNETKEPTKVETKIQTQEPVKTETEITKPVEETVETWIDLSKVKFYNGSFAYDGKPHSITVSKLSIPEGVTVEYVGNDQTEIGEYTVTAILRNTEGQKIGHLDATLTINKIKKKITGVKFEDLTVNWEKDKTFELTASNIPEGVYATYENNTSSEIGKYNAVCNLFDEYDDEPLGTLNAVLNVKYRVINDEEVFTSQTIIVDGESHKIEIAEAKASEFANVEYSNNEGTDAGTYKAVALITTNSGDKYEYHALLTLENAYNEEFKEFVDWFLVYYLEGDQQTINLFFEDYTKYGFKHQPCEQSYYEPYNDEYLESDKEEIKMLEDKLNKFDPEKLNSYQKADYKKIKDIIDEYTIMTNNLNYLFMRSMYIDQFGGYPSDIPTSMEAYVIRCKQDIDDMIAYIAHTKVAFPTYINWALDKAEAGYPYSNFTIHKMVEYLDGVSGRGKEATDDTKPYYLIEVLTKKITDNKEALGLTDDEEKAYIEKLNSAFDDFFQAHIDLANGLLEKCLNLCPEDKQYYLASYGEEGHAFYEVLLRNRLGIEQPMEEYLAYLEEKTQKYYNLYSYVNSAGNSDEIGSGKVKIVESDDPLVIIEYLKEFAKTIVYELESEPTIDVAYMDETLTENTTTTAYYMKSAVDSKDKEYIHLNAQILADDYLETISTLAHEGYPGHLYAYVYSKEKDEISVFSKIDSNVGHGEGWAKYVESKLCDYIAEQKGKAAWKSAMDQTKYWGLFVYNIYTRVDYGINFQSWGVEEVKKYFKDNNLVMDDDGAKEMIQTLSEMPSQYASYGYGATVFYEIHEEAQTILGEHYDEREFNEMILGHGWIDLTSLVKQYQDYMDAKCHIYGIDYEK